MKGAGTNARRLAFDVCNICNLRSGLFLGGGEREAEGGKRRKGKESMISGYILHILVSDRDVQDTAPMHARKYIMLSYWPRLFKGWITLSAG